MHDLLSSVVYVTWTFAADHAATTQSTGLFGTLHDLIQTVFWHI